MREAPFETQASLRAQTEIPALRHCGFGGFLLRASMAETARRQAAALDEDRLIPVHGNNHLTAVGVPSFLVATLLADHTKSMAAQDANNFLGVADWKAFAHASAT